MVCACQSKTIEKYNGILQNINQRWRAYFKLLASKDIKITMKTLNSSKF